MRRHIQHVMAHLLFQRIVYDFKYNTILLSKCNKEIKIIFQYAIVISKQEASHTDIRGD